MTRRGLVVTGLAFLAPVFAIGACVTDADRAPAQSDCPSETHWPVVSQVLEHDCGTIECHGAPSRPLRILGRNGTRLSTSDRVGIDATTPEELAQNRASVCGLEPEAMTAVLAGDAEVETLTVVRKPRLIEAHKGGRVWLADSQGYACLVSWIDGDVDVAACDADLAQP